MHKIIPVTVRDKIATKTGDEVYICGNSDFVIEFDFDEEWDEHDTKTARFEWNEGFHDVIFSGNTCPVPIISDTHRFHVGVYAGNLRTTTAAYVPARKSILCGSGLPHDPPPDVYAQIMEKLGGGVSQEQIEQAIDKAMDEDFLVIHINVNTASASVDEIDAAAAAGRMVFLEHGGYVYTYIGKRESQIDPDILVPAFMGYIKDKDDGAAWAHSIEYMPDSQDVIWAEQRLYTPNAYRLILTGAVEAEYDGSDQVKVKIPKVGEDTDLTVKSSTPGSTKKFKITVDDSGTITATELT